MKITLIFPIMLVLISCVHKVHIDSYDCTLEGRLVVDVEINKRTNTEIPSVITCYNEFSCWPWKEWYRYEGKVIQAFSGKIESKDITFAISQHSAFSLEEFQTIVVALTRIKSTELLDTNDIAYEVTDFCI